jgi:3-hydroxyisobutyrate dehydrogenase
MARQVFHMGPRGAGNAAKLIKNLTTGAEILIFYQALRIGEAAGVHYRDALEMMRKSYAGPLLDHWRDSFDESGSGPKPIMTKNGTIFEKDIPLAGALAREYGLDLPLADALVAEALRVRR